MNDQETKVAMTVGCGFAMVILLIVLWAFIGSSIQYADGHRDGVIQKLSHKGLIWKTYEGELATAGFKLRGEGRGGNAWEFSVTDPSVFAQLGRLPQDAPVRLHYVQYCATLPWLGSTTYRVTRVELLGD